MIAHKIQRMTFDIDFILTLEDCRKIEPEIVALGYSILSRTDAFVQFKAEKPGLRDLDFLISDVITVEKLRTQGQKISIAGRSTAVTFPVFKKEMLPPSLRSVDEINSWIEQDYPVMFDRERYQREKRRLSVNKPFFLKK
ncbi:MAG: hypothetical protein JXA71_13280 [Chitinispirillaceae bacterium]|nr:hypothetical protein [Chitinispirillaceae bacterium]